MKNNIKDKKIFYKF